MTFADELRYYLSRDMCLQYIRFSRTRVCGKHELEAPVYYKRTHGSRSDHLQSLWGGRDYYLRIGG
jgi:hypothetical protein